ncbi:hypothetical protein [Brevibacterium luteolum]|uniref:hypothetical protein n=1 Tax=Brevibacterium luteolum TaxID=199591 RepID=UPI003B671692
MRTTTRVLTAVTVALFAAAFWVPVLRFTDRRFSSDDIGLISAATAGELSPLIFPGILAAVVLCFCAFTGILPRASGWIGLAGCVCIAAGAVSVLSNLWMFGILWDGVTADGMPTGGMILPEPWWGTALIAAATLTLALASILQLVTAHRSQRAQTQATGPTPPAPAGEEGGS